ncbi:MAG: molybdopterin-dependent oxidoreductase [Mycobacteriaceae bacterium]|uniref:molybdopterin-dependent oxidoreductase n=1 Tax=Corynebacterium sp. TaxID=1720 RepID=UPI003F9A2629
MTASTVTTATSVDTVCGYCGVGCGLTLTADSAGRDVLSSTGTPDHPANRGRLCTKGSTTADLLNAGGRQQTALVNGDPVDLDTALGHTARRFAEIREEHGDDAVAFYVSGQMSMEAQYLANKLAKGYFGTNMIESNSRLCMASAATGYKQSLGADGPPGSYDDLDHADVFLVIGANMADCHPILFLRMMDRVKQGAKLIVVDPRRTATAKKADLHLPVRPGTDMALLNGLLRLVLDNGDVDGEFIAEFTDGWDAMDEHLADYPVDTVAEITGLDGDDLRQAAAWIGSTDKFMSLWTMGLNQSVHGTWHTNALCNLHLATGSICRTGAGPFSLTGQPNAMGGREMGYMGPGLPGQRTVLNEGHRKDVEEIWGIPDGTLHTRLGGGTVDMFESLASEDEGTLKAVWVICTNPVGSVPNRGKVIEGLEAAEFVVVQDAYAGSETSAYADVVLPAALWTESEGVMVNSERNLTLTSPLLSAPGDAEPDWMLICRVARAMGCDGFDFSSAAEVFDEIRRFHNPLTGWDIRGVDYGRLRRGPVQWPAAPQAGSRNPVRYVNDGISQDLFTDGTGHTPRLAFPTPTRRAQFVARPYLPAAERPDATFPLVLTTGRLPHQWHTMTKTKRVAALMKLNPHSFLQIHPSDAEDLGIGEGDVVEVSSRRGTARAPAVLSPDIVPGTCFIPMHYADTPVNAVTNDAVDAESLQPEFKACAVALQLIEKAAPVDPADSSGTGFTAGTAATIVWASQTGTVEDVIPSLVSGLDAAGVNTGAVCADRVRVADLVGYTGTVLFVVSSTGDGDAPDNAVALWDELSDTPANLDGLHTAVLGFGDSSYADFCGFARKLDDRLTDLGATRVADLVCCEPDFEEEAASWQDAVVTALGGDPGLITRDTSGDASYSRRNPLPTALVENTRLTATGSGKDVRRFGFAVPDGTLTYSTGDALGVWPRNRPEVVGEWLAHTGVTADDELVESLTTDYDLTGITPDLLRLVHGHHPEAGLEEIAADPARLQDFSWGRQALDVLASHPVEAPMEQWLEVLPAMKPRMYSISSSPRTDPNRVEVTVSAVRYSSREGRERHGVCSTFLADSEPGDAMRIFIKPNKSFGPPVEPEAPMIMIGPGTGVAPFRGFLHDRVRTGSTGENWLFFGDRHEATDFLYRDELTGMHNSGVLTRLDLAFSRDQAEKVYVQDLMRHHAGELWSWLDRGAHLYVCGDAKRMATDVDQALRQIVEEQGRMAPDAASSFISALAAERRYVRDVY